MSDAQSLNPTSGIRPSTDEKNSSDGGIAPGYVKHQLSAADVEYRRMCEDLAGSVWTPSREAVSQVETAVLVRRVDRASHDSSTPSESLSSDTLLEKRVTADVQEANDCNGNGFKPKYPMGVQNGLAGTAKAIVESPKAIVAPPSRSFADLATVVAMGTGRTAPVIGFDTEFSYRPDGTRRIGSYQFSLVDPCDARFRFDVILLPLIRDARLAVQDCLAVVVRVSGLWRAAGLCDPRGPARRDFWSKDVDFRSNLETLYRQYRVPLVLAGHYLNADLTAFARPRRQYSDGRFDDIMRRVTSASGGLVSLKPVRMVAYSGTHGSGERWLPLSITVRDTMGQTGPDSKRLESLGEACGVPKIDVGDAINDMGAYRRNHLVDFLDYGANDSVIVLEYLASLWGDGAVPPVTISGGGAHALRAGIQRYWGIEKLKVDVFTVRFQGLVSVDDGVEPSDDGLSFYAVRSLTPVDGDANQALSAFKQAYHGGLNACLSVGSFPRATFDHDVQSAYPSAMASVIDVDFEHGCIEEVIKDRDLTNDDFPLSYVTPLVAFVGWDFPEDVEPCLPVRVGQSIIYPRSSRGLGKLSDDEVGASDFKGFDGAWCCGPELLLALALGAHVWVQIGYRLKVLVHEGAPSRSMRAAVRQMVVDRDTAKQLWGKKSLEEQMLKVATNSGYGKLAQDVSERSGWNAWQAEMENIGGSAVTSPYHAAMITSLVRALLLAMENEIDVISVTTDGFISETPDVEQYDCYGLAPVFRDARDALVGDPKVWEVKHRQSDLVNLTTRGNVSACEGGVLAKAGLKTPKHIERGSLDERRWFRDLAVSREGKILNPYTTFPCFRELSRVDDRVDFDPVERRPEVSLDFDMKRRPRFDTLHYDMVDGHEIAGFDTEAWDTVAEYKRARDIARHIADVRPGTTGEQRPTGCLRARSDWLTFKRRYDSAAGRRVRTAASTLLTELVAAHKQGLVRLPVLGSGVPVGEKLAWLSSLGCGAFSRAQWDHMSNTSRRLRVLADADINAVIEFADNVSSRQIIGNQLNGVCNGTG